MRILALVRRIIRQFLCDWKTLALIFLAPLLILTLINQILAGEPHTPKIATLHVPSPVSEMLNKTGATVEAYHKWEKAYETLLQGEVDAILDMSKAVPAITLEGSDPMISRKVLQLIKASLHGVKTQFPAVEVVISYLYGMEDMLLFDYAGPIVIAFLSFFFVFLSAGVSFLRERTNGTLERLLGTPIRRWELVAGYMVGFGIVVVLQATIIALFAVHVLNVLMAGQMALLVIVTVLLAISALTLGMLLSSFAQNEFQIVQFVPVVIIPQLLFSGLFNLDAFPFWLRFIGFLMPVQYGVDALNQIMIRGKGWHDIVFAASALTAFSIIFCLLNIIALRRHRSL